MRENDSSKVTYLGANISMWLSFFVVFVVEDENGLTYLELSSISITTETNLTSTLLSGMNSEKKVFYQLLLNVYEQCWKLAGSSHVGTDRSWDKSRGWVSPCDQKSSWANKNCRRNLRKSLNDFASLTAHLETRAARAVQIIAQVL